MSDSARIAQLEEQVKQLSGIISTIAEHLDVGGVMGVRDIPPAKLILRVKKLEEQVKQLQNQTVGS